MVLAAYVAHLLVYEKIKHQRPGGDTTKKAFTISCPKPDDEIFLDTLQDEVETPWRKSLCKVVSKGEGSLEDLEPDGSTKSNLWSDAPFMSFTTLSRIVRGGVMLLQSRAVSHDRTVPTDR